MKWKEIEDKMGEVRYGGKEMADNLGKSLNIWWDKIKDNVELRWEMRWERNVI